MNINRENSLFQKKLGQGILAVLGAASTSVAHTSNTPHIHSTEWMSVLIPTVAIVAGAFFTFSAFQKK